MCLKNQISVNKVFNIVVALLNAAKSVPNSEKLQIHCNSKHHKTQFCTNK